MHERSRRSGREGLTPIPGSGARAPAGGANIPDTAETPHMPRFDDSHLCRRVQRHHVSILVVALLATLVGGWLSSRLTLESDLAELLPESFASVQALERMQAEVGGISVLKVVLQGDDFSALTSMAEELEPRLEAAETVRLVEYRNPVEFYRQHALLYLDTTELDSLRQAVRRTIDREKQRLNPLMVDDLFGDGGGEGAAADDGASLEEWEERYREREPREYFSDPDSTVLVLQVYPSEEATDLDFNRRMLEEVRGIVQGADLERFDPDVSVYYGGNVKNRIDEFETISGDILGTAAYGIGGVFLLILLYFRSLAAAALISVSLFASLSWTFGATYLAVGQLNTITGFLFVILFGMGIDYGVHAFARYREGRQAGLDRDGALDQMVCGTGAALGTTTLTTSAAFFSLLLMDFRGFSELGLIAGTGLVFAFAAMVVLLPALIVLAERMGWLEIEPVEGRSLSFEPRPLPGARGLLAGGALATAVAVVGFLQVDFQYDFTDLRAVTDERQKVGELTRDVFDESESPAVLLAESREQAQAVVETVRERMRRDTLTPTVDDVRSVYSLVPENQAERLGVIRDIRRLVVEEAEGVLEGEDARRVEELQGYLQVDDTVTLRDLPAQDTRRFLTRDGEVSDFVLVFPSVLLRDGKNAMAFRDDVGTIVTAAGDTLHAASPNIIVADLLTMVLREGKLAVGLSVLVVFLLLLAYVRSVGGALVILVPLLVGVVWMGGLMALVGMQLNLFNIVVFPMVIGIGVDSGVHIFHRYREEGPGSLPLVLRRTGLAVTLATATTMVGFSGLVVASHPGLQSIGKLALVGLASTLLAALTVQPALLEVAGAGGPAAGEGTAPDGEREDGEREDASTAG